MWSAAGRDRRFSALRSKSFLLGNGPKTGLTVSRFSVLGPSGTWGVQYWCSGLAHYSSGKQRRLRASSTPFPYLLLTRCAPCGTASCTCGAAPLWRSEGVNKAEDTAGYKNPYSTPLQLFSPPTQTQTPASPPATLQVRRYITIPPPPQSKTSFSTSHLPSTPHTHTNHHYYHYPTTRTLFAMCLGKGSSSNGASGRQDSVCSSIPPYLIPL